jgi:hypothetical protein
MKSCPTCNRTYPDDTLAFCLIDGSILSAPYHPDETQRIPPPRTTTSTPTEIMKDTLPSKEPAPRLQSTMLAPPPQLPSSYAEKHPDYSTEKRSLTPWLIVGGAIFLVGIFAAVMLGSRWSANQNLGENQANSGTRSTPDNQSKSACGRTLSAALYDKWMQLGGEGGRLGCPITDESEAPASPQGTTGRWIQFAKGDGGYLVMHQSGPHSGKAVEVSGCMFKLYFSQGGTKSWLGFPLSDGREISSGARQEFEGGYAVWDSRTYVCQAHKN